MVVMNFMQNFSCKRMPGIYDAAVSQSRFAVAVRGPGLLCLVYDAAARQSRFAVVGGLISASLPQQHSACTVLLAKDHHHPAKRLLFQPL